MEIVLIVSASAAIVIPLVTAVWMRRALRRQATTIREERRQAPTETVVVGATTAVKDVVVLDDVMLVEFRSLLVTGQARHATWATMPHSDSAREVVECWMRDQTPVTVRYLAGGSEISAADEHLGLTWLTSSSH